ncbi:hypothetical protein A2477_04155 [Candidatus Falkowbacteria bacterium RIFOXYC2_FULL_47_12]|uniref:HTH cro/C1-type domain-containing protein n=2 Tax=Candidatus Falkowiibacteriota TaxID=1752728 RepID=A0A1F5TPF0_9BACT|nr:MAG: hypothetical protein A2242_03295 [Candidatus Falkowbacteria bacterium RIFOXYA2_FULL_47_9]OGF40689.1 MAG: hypothetical protein A2477_04155 [Candidatus Falkowbacteria bacterium RIFOXYC2_FULL_47_12]
MNIQPIKTPKDHKEALKKVEKLWDAKPDTKAGDELEVLTTLIEKYEADTYNILPPDPVEAIKFRMEQMNVTQTDIARLIGANRISEVLNRKRKLSLNMIKVFHTHLNIPVDSLVN